jgi:hypothetical protein
MEEQSGANLLECPYRVYYFDQSSSSLPKILVSAKSNIFRDRINIEYSWIKLSNKYMSPKTDHLQPCAFLPMLSVAHWFILFFNFYPSPRPGPRGSESEFVSDQKETAFLAGAWSARNCFDSVLKLGFACRGEVRYRTCTHTTTIQA